MAQGVRTLPKFRQLDRLLAKYLQALEMSLNSAAPLCR